MLKKMKLRFILAAITAFGIVMLVLVLGINLIVCSVTAARQDATLVGIVEYEQMKLSESADAVPMLSEMSWADGPEADYTTRFFTVRCDEENQVISISQDHIASIDTDAVSLYTKKILSGKRQKGYYGDYRYLVKEQEEGTMVAFLNVSGDKRFVKSLLIISVIIALVSLAVVSLLTIAFSNKAIRPYAKNAERQKRFITDAGHELKTPLTSISTSADILAMEYEGDEWVENIQKQTVRLTRLVSNLVALSRLDEEAPFPEKTEFSVSDAVWETAEPFASLAKAGGKRYSQHIAENLTLVGERSAMQQLLSILLDNAVRYSEEGGEIRLDVYRRRGKIVMEVFNTCRLPEGTDLSRLFDRFYRLDESRSANTGGTGIGLSMAQAIAESHGGAITVSSRSGDSILFKVVL